jgi:tripartite-type tricarboxylate transporter receptor subunit TctC
LIAILAPASTGAAQDFPSHPITMIVPFAAGGPNDTIGRIVTERMRMSLGQPVIIKNVPDSTPRPGTRFGCPKTRL